MSLSSQIVTGSVSALNLIKNYLDNPSISPQTPGSTLPLPIALKTVAFQCEKYRELMPSDISQQLIIDSSAGKKLYVTDNIAPRPRTWEVSGYIAAAPWELIASPVLQLTQAKKAARLREMRNSREMLVWRTKNGSELVFVGIKELDIDSRPEVQNRIPITMTVQEIPILQYTAQGIGVPVGSTNPAAITDKIGQVIAVAMPIATIAAAIGSTALDSQTQESDTKTAINVPANRTVKTYYKIDLPATTPGLNFSFIAKVAGESITLAFKWTDKWNITATMTDGSTRFAGLYPNVMNWTGYTDYGLVGYTALESVGYDDLPKVSMFMVAWNE
jgi:hypothetical protein